MSDEDGRDIEKEVTVAVATEVRRVRDTLGWRRRDLCDRVPFNLHFQTLAGYERGTVQCTVSRFVALCHEMGVPAPDVLAWAMQRTQVDIPLTGMRIDLNALIRDNRDVTYRAVRRWARKRRGDDPGATGVAHLTWSAIRELATLFDFRLYEFVAYLAEYTPLPTPLERHADR